MYLLDTNVVSELRRPRPHGAVLEWLRGVDEASLRLSAVTIGELQAGVEITRENAPTKAAEIERWIDDLLQSIGILPMDAACFSEWARLLHGRAKALSEDAMIAATARVHGLVVVTRNLRDFAPLSVEVLNPFEAA